MEDCVCSQCESVGRSIFRDVKFLCKIGDDRTVGENPRKSRINKLCEVFISLRYIKNWVDEAGRPYDSFCNRTASCGDNDRNRFIDSDQERDRADGED